jgi:uncharacterized protein
MEFGWNESRAARNKRKHGVAFEAVKAFEFDTAIIRSIDWEDGEERVVTLGFIGTSCMYWSTLSVVQ